MGDIALSASKRVAYFRQSALGTVAASGDAASTFRRSSSSLQFSRAEFESGEKRQDYQVADAGLGTHQTSGSLDADFFYGAYEDFIESAVRRDFSAVAGYTAASSDGLTIVGSTGVITRANGSNSFITDGFRVGMVVKFTGLTTTADNNRPFLIVALTATTMTVVALNGTALTDVGSADETCAIVATGKVTYLPTTSHTDHYYTVEEYYSNPSTDFATVFRDMKVGGMTINQAPNGMVTISFPFTGTGYTTDYSGGSAPYFSGPTAAGTTRSFRTAATFLRINGATVAVCTQFNLALDLGLEAPAVVGSLYSPEVFYGRAARVTFDASVYLKDLSYRAALRAETDISATIVLQESGSGAFFVIHMARCHINTNTIDDGDTGLAQSITATALLPDVATGVQQTSLLLQDSTLS